MNARLDKWNRRYAEGAHTYDFVPSVPLPEALALAPPGRALDLAAGAGRHALYLAQRGWDVVAVDGAEAGLARLRDEAMRRGVARRIACVLADLEAHPRSFVPEPEGYDLVCDFYFLDREWFEALGAAVRPGGLFVAAIHVRTEEATEGMNPAFLLDPGELRAVVEGWGFEVLHAREGSASEAGHHHGTAEVIARKPTARSAAG
jgi:SAM-dependent methyltransferase